MRFIAELDQKTASVFESFADQIFNGQLMVKKSAMKGEPFHNLLRLEEFGLISGVQGNLNNYADLEAGGGVSFHFKEKSIGVKVIEKGTLQIPVIVLTSVGEEIASILPAKDNLDRVNEFVETIPKKNVSHISYGKLENGAFVGEPLILWEKPQD
jgi:hypothetical protein